MGDRCCDDGEPCNPEPVQTTPWDSKPGDGGTVDVEGCVGIETCDGNPLPVEVTNDPLVVDIGGASITVDGDVNIPPDGPIATQICVDGVTGVLAGKCDDGVLSWHSHDVGAGIVEGVPEGFTFGACPTNDLPLVACNTGSCVTCVNGEPIDGAGTGDPVPFTSIVTPTVEGSQPFNSATLSSAQTGVVPEWVGGLPGSLQACLNEDVIDTLINPQLPAGTTSFTLNWDVVDVGQDQAAIVAYQCSTGTYIPFDAASTVHASNGLALTGPVGPGSASWTVPSGVDPSDVCVQMLVVGGVLNDPDPGFCDIIELSTVVAEGTTEGGPVDPEPPVTGSGVAVQTKDCNSDAALDKLCQIADLLTETVVCDIEYWVLCDDNGPFRQAIQTCYDTTGQVVSVGVLNTALDGTADYIPAGEITECTQDFEIDPVVYCDANSNSFIRWYTTINAIQVAVEDTDINGEPFTPAAPFTEGPCPDVCIPGSFYTTTADQTVLTGGYNAIAVFNPDPCCALTVTTNLGSFVIPQGVTAYSPSDFTCGLITELTVAGDCDMSNITINLQNTGQ